MSRTKSLRSNAQLMLQALVKEERKNAGLSQQDVADGLGWRQADISKIEAGERRIDVIEFIRLARVIGFDPVTTIRRIKAHLD